MQKIEIEDDSINDIMGVLPIKVKDEVSNTVREKLTLAAFYEAAGMEAKAKIIRKRCILEICGNNGIAIIQTSVGPGNCCGMEIDKSIFDWMGLNWEVKNLEEVCEDVPVPVLEKMALVKDQTRLKIAFPRYADDPVLLYELPLFDGNAFIELARWE